MTKHYCDRCGAENKEPHKKRIPKKVSENGRDFIVEDVDLCGKCLWELKLFEDALIPNLSNLRVSMYGNFMRNDSSEK